MTQPTHTIKVVVDRTQADAQLAQFERRLNGSSSAAQRMANSLNAANDNTSKFGAGLNRAGGQAKNFADQLGIAKYAALGLGAGIGLLMVKATQVTSKFQTMKASLVVATGSMQAASREFARLQQFAAKTPFTTEAAVQGFIKLKNLGLVPSERAMKSYGNTAASMGKDMMQMVEAVADASTGEFERLKEFGIKSKVEGDKVKFTFAGVTTSVANNSAQIQNYLIRLGETKFGNAMDLQAKTLSGVMSTLSDTIQNLLYEFGQGFAPALAEAANGFASAAGGATAFAREAGKLTGEVLGGLLTAMKFLVENGKVLGGVLTVLATRVIALQVAAGAAVAIRGLQGAIAAAGIASALAGTRMSAATVAMTGLRTAGTGLMALMGGPWVAAAMLLAGGLYYLYTKETEASKGADLLKSSQEKLNAVLADPTATNAKLDQQVRLLDATIKQTEADLDAAKAQRAKIQGMMDWANLAAKLPGGQIFGAAAGLAGGAYLANLNSDIAELETKLDNAKQNSHHLKLDRMTGYSFTRMRANMDMYGTTTAPGADAGLATGGSTNGSGSGKDKPMISAQEAMRRYTLSLKGTDLKASENRWSGGTTMRHGDRDHNNTAVDVNYAKGNGPAEKARLDVEALKLQKMGFTVLWNGKVYAGGGDGPTGNITRKGPGDWQHKTHLHAKAKGPMAADGAPSNLDNAQAQVNALDAAAEAEERRANAFKEANTQYGQLISQYGQEAKLLTTREQIIEDTKKSVADIYATSLANGKISAADLAAKQAAAVQAKLTATDARVAQGIEERRALRVADRKNGEAEIQAILTGQKADQNAMVDAADRMRAEEEERTRILEAGGDVMSQYAKDAITAAGAAAQEANERARSLRALESMQDRQERMLEDQARKGNQNAGFELENLQYGRERGRVEQERKDALAGVTDPMQRKKIEETYDRILNHYEDVHKDKIDEVSSYFGQQLSGAIQQIGQGLADMIGGKLGKVIGTFADGLSSIAGMIQRDEKGKIGFGDPSKWQAGPNAQGFEKLTGGLKGVSDNLAQIFGADGKAGSFFTGLSKTLGQAGQGAQVGSAMAPIMKALGLKTSTTGAQIGGAAGNIIGTAVGGPVGGMIGSAIGSVAGGLIGGLFKKTPKARTSVGFDPLTGQYRMGAVTSKGKGAAERASNIGNGIASGINSTAAALGGELTNGGSVGVYVKKKKMYVNGVRYKNEDDAIFAGMKAGLQSSLKGVTAFSMRMIQQSTKENFDSLIAIGASYEKLVDDLARLRDPVMGEAKEFMKQMDDMVNKMTAAGATGAELADVLQYKELKLKEILDDNLNSLKDFRKSLSGEGSGVTALNRLNAAMGEFDAMKTTIAGGGTVDQNKFTELGQTIFGLAGDVYGTSTSAFQDIRAMLMSATDGLIGNYESAFNAATATTQAIQQQTVAVQVGNDYLRQILGAILGGDGSVGGGASPRMAEGQIRYY